MLRLAVLLGLAGCVWGGPQPSSYLPNYDGKVVGGTVADIENFPYQLSLQYNGRHSCGASILSTVWVVTAAHCVCGSSARWYTVRAGSASHATGGAVYPVKEILSHPDYNKGTFSNNDIALITLSEPLQLSSAVQPISLPNPGDVVPAGTIAVVSGWGFTSEDGSNSPVLLHVSVPVVSTVQCRQAYGETSITDQMLCAGVMADGNDACQNDCGGPLVAAGKLIGVVSFGNGCAPSNYPGVYADVASLRTWIKDVSEF